MDGGLYVQMGSDGTDGDDDDDTSIGLDAFLQTQYSKDMTCPGAVKHYADSTKSGIERVYRQWQKSIPASLGGALLADGCT